MSGRSLLEVSVPVATVWARPDAPRSVDAPAVLDQADVPGWAAAMDHRTRRGLHGRVVTQLLLGEPVEVLERRQGWARVRAPRQPSSRDSAGYPGWVRRAHLAAPVRRDAGRALLVAEDDAVCVLDTGSTLELSFGTRLWTECPEQGAVLLPGDRRGTVVPGDMRPVGSGPAYHPDAVLGTARRFLGLRYLWGGTSSWGLDCSGLVHLTYRAHGVVVPRDAFDQADVVEPVPLHEVRPGDLYFFARPGQRIYHVGFVTRPVAADGARWMLHAPESGELVEDAPLAEHRHETLVSAGRVRGQQDAGQDA